MNTGKSSPWKRYLPLGLMVCAGLVLTVAAFFLFESMEMKRIEVEFKRAAERRVGAVRDVINDERVMLGAVNAVFVGSEDVSREEFHDVITNFKDYQGGARAFQWMPRVGREARETFEASIRGEGFDRFRIFDTASDPALERDEYFPVVYIEPFSPNKEILGFDPSTDPARGGAMAIAIQKREAAATAPIRLLQEGCGFTVYVPVYDKDEELRGFVAGAFEARAFIDGSMDRVASQGLDVRFLDLAAAEEEQLLYAYDHSPYEPGWVAPLETDLMENLELGELLERSNRQWYIQVLPTLEFIREHRSWYPFGVFPIGLLITALVAGYLFTIKGQKEKVERLVEKRTAELKETQLQLIQAEKLESIGRLAAGVAHEVKNPLAIIQLGLDFMKQTVKEGEESAEVVEEMDEAVGRADKVIKGLVDFSRSDKLDMERNDLNEVVRESLDMVKHELSSRKIRLEQRLAEGLPPVLLDRSKIQQVLINLCMNAAQAMDREGALSVSTSLNGKEGILLEVEDTGPGIPEDKLTKIFDPFFTTKPVGKGTGLGLSVVRNIIELHNAAIDVKNRPEGGAMFSITFPVRGEEV